MHGEGWQWVASGMAAGDQRGSGVFAPALTNGVGLCGFVDGGVDQVVHDRPRQRCSTTRIASSGPLASDVTIR
jgi:hypothetical protein